MSGVMDKFRNMTRGLSNNEEEQEVPTTPVSKSGGFSLLSKFGVSKEKEKEPERRHKTLLVIDSKENDW